MRKILILILLLLPVLAFSQVKIDSIPKLTEVDTTTRFPTIHGPNGAKQWKYFTGKEVRTFSAADIINRAYVPDTTGSHSVEDDFGNFIRSTVDGNIYYCDYNGMCKLLTLLPGYGIVVENNRTKADTSSLDGLVSKSRLANALDDVVGGGGNASGRAVQVLTADGTDTLDFGGTSYATDYWQLDLSSVTICSLYFTNPNTSIVPTYNIHFENASTDTVVFVSTFQDANGDVITSYVFEQGQIVPIYYENSTYHTNYLSITGTNTAASISYTNNSQTTVQGALDSLFSVTGATISEGAPSYSDAAGTLGYDNNYLYVRTSVGIGRVALTEYNPLTLSYDTSMVAYHLAGQGITESGGIVSQWNDLSGNGNHLTQSTPANRPTVDGSGNVVFDGANDYLNLPSYYLNTLSSFTIISVFETTSISNNEHNILDYNDRAGNYYIRINVDTVTGSPSGQNRIVVGASNYIPLILAVDTVAFSETVLLSLAFEESDSNSYRLNAVEKVVSEPTTTFSDIGFAGGKTIGSYSTGSGNFWAGKMKLFLIYDRKLTPAELAVVESEINSYFSIY